MAIENPRYPGTSFQPGVHQQAEGFWQMVDETRKGDLSKHTWNREVSKRLRDLNAKILTLDGPKPNLNPETEDITDLMTTWVVTPDSPSALNDQGQIFVVRGDPYNTGFSQEFSTLSRICLDAPIGTQIDLLSDGVSEFRKTTIEYINFLKNSRSSATANALGMWLLGLSFLPKRDVSSRRTFLKFTASAAAAIASTAWGLYTETIVIPDMTSSGDDNIGNLKNTLDIDNRLLSYKVLYPLVSQLPHKDWVIGRTALLFAKHFDSVDMLGLGNDIPGAVVAGTAHSVEASSLINDTSECIKVIQEFAQEIYDLVRNSEVLKPYNLPENMIKAAIRNHLAQTDIVKITGNGNDATYDPEEFLRANIKVVKKFYSPRVLYALKDFA